MPNPTWDLTNQDCDAFDNGWTKGGSGTYSVTTTTEDGRSVYYFTAAAGSGNYGYAVNTNLANWNECTAEWVFKVNPFGCSDYAGSSCYLRDKDKYAYSVFIYHHNNVALPYVKILCGDSSIRVRIDITSSDWHTLRVVVNSSHSMWTWIDGQFLAKLSYSGSTGTYSANTIGFQCWYAAVSGTNYAWVDHIRMSSSKSQPDNHGLIKVQGASSYGVNCRVRSDSSSEGGYTFNGPDKISIKFPVRYRNDVVYTLPLVDTTDAYASNVRVYNGSSVKAIQRLPDSF